MLVLKKVEQKVETLEFGLGEFKLVDTYFLWKIVPLTMI